MKNLENSETTSQPNHERHDPFTRNARLLCYRIRKSLHKLSDIDKSNPQLIETPGFVELRGALRNRQIYLQHYLDKPVPSVTLVHKYVEALELADQWEDAQLSILTALFKKQLLGFEGSTIRDYLLSNFRTSTLGAAVHFTNQPKRTNEHSKKSMTAAEYENRINLIRVFDAQDTNYDDLLNSLALSGVVSFQISVLYHELIHRNQFGNVAVFPEVVAVIAPLIHTSVVYHDKLNNLVSQLKSLLRKRSSEQFSSARHTPTKKDSYSYLLLELDAYFAGFPFGFHLLDGRSAHKLIDLLTSSDSYQGINPDVISKDKAVDLAERLLFLKANGCPPSVLNNLIRASDFDHKNHSFTYIDEFVQALRSGLPPHTGKEWKAYMRAWILDWEAERFINQIKVADFVQNELRKRAIALA